jgi:hypothetical protein
MNTKTTATRRLKRGVAILAASEVVNVRLVQKRLGAFAEAQRTYTKAERAVEAAEAALRANQGRLDACDVQQDEAVEQLVLALINDGQPRTSPFAAFAMPAPSAIRQLPFADEAQAIHKLASAVQQDHAIGAAARRAAQEADDMAKKMDKALVLIDKLRASVRSARHTRSGAGKTWILALAALKRGARAAADDGAPDLYMKLFGLASRPKKKTASPTPDPAPTPAPVNEAQAEHTQ